MKKSSRKSSCNVSGCKGKSIICGSLGLNNKKHTQTGTRDTDLFDGYGRFFDFAEGFIDDLFCHNKFIKNIADNF